MCGITGYVGPRNAVAVAVESLRRLEYRGYDSAGVAFTEGNGLSVVKRAGKIGALEEALQSTNGVSHTAIGHTRWATHGAPTETNAHPHCDTGMTVAIVHNGIIENYLELRHELARNGTEFRSETDTEVVAHLVAAEMRAGNGLTEAVRRTSERLRGSFAIAVVAAAEPGVLVAHRQDSPLIIGLGERENLLASDIPAVLPYTRRVVILDNGDTVTVRPDEVQVIDAAGRSVERSVRTVDWDMEAAEKGGYEHFMLKEMHEQPDSLAQTLRGRVVNGTIDLGVSLTREQWLSFKRFVMIACGTAYHAGLIGSQMIEGYLRIPVKVEFSSEFRYSDPLVGPDDLAILISQSGETADTLAAMRLCKERGATTLGIVNVVGSTLARECDHVLYTQAGPEICVASTKAYSAQVCALMMIALYLDAIRGVRPEAVPEMVAELVKQPERVRELLACEEQIKRIAPEVKDTPICFYLGRGTDAAVALEGALKLKELAYIPTQECPAGEMKHGPLALVEPGALAVFVATQSRTRDKVAGNIKEMKSRGARALAIAQQGEGVIPEVADYCIEVPRCGHDLFAAPLAVVPLQFLAYYVARARGCDIDQPRNLAKSVTVE
jgi:glucosamine--fructose-6-phosphate aminotransferase (isomerizing)